MGNLIKYSQRLAMGVYKNEHRCSEKNDLFLGIHVLEYVNLTRDDIMRDVFCLYRQRFS